MLETFSSKESLNSTSYRHARGCLGDKVGLAPFPMKRLNGYVMQDFENVVKALTLEDSVE